MQFVGHPAFENYLSGVAPEFIRNQKVNVMIAGGMGPKAVNMFNDFGIEVATGVGGIVEKVLAAYFEGKDQGAILCNYTV